MKVSELIELLQKCNPNDSVMYDAQNGVINEGWALIDTAGEVATNKCPYFSIDDVQVGYGTLRGNVYLTADVYSEMK